MEIYYINKRRVLSLWYAERRAIVLSESRTTAVFINNGAGETIRIYIDGQRVSNAPFADKRQEQQNG